MIIIYFKYILEKDISVNTPVYLEINRAWFINNDTMEKKNQIFSLCFTDGRLERIEFRMLDNTTFSKYIPFIVESKHTFMVN